MGEIAASEPRLSGTVTVHIFEKPFEYNAQKKYDIKINRNVSIYRHSNTGMSNAKKRVSCASKHQDSPGT
jgi:hypothetical protein